MNPSAAPPLIFSWAPPRRRARALAFFLIASLLLHAFCFYLFQIVYATSVALPPAPARLSVITADDPESGGFLRWIEAEDPALATTTQKPPETKPIALPPLEHVPSYATHQPTLKTLPETTPALQVPSVFPVGAKREPTPAPPAVPPARRKTAILVDETAAEFQDAKFPEPQFSSSRPDAPSNARFRLAVDAAGAVRYCFLIESSGDPDLDEQARAALKQGRFSPAALSSPAWRWTVADILWGSDLTPPPISPSPTAAKAP